MNKNKKIIIKTICAIIIMFSVHNLLASRDYIEVLNEDGVWEKGERIGRYPGGGFFIGDQIFKIKNFFQPDGTRLIISDVTYPDGYNVLYVDGYTIILDSLSGYWCYARQNKDGWLESTGLPIHLNTPREAGVKKNEQQSAERRNVLI